ncbi:MAG: PAS domain S-box protein [Anaerolineaceae bacterium]|nr:PAS domain S-box protein [Anaerolineaceae bacterium]
MKERIRVLFVEDNQVDQMAFKRFVKQENLSYDYKICGSVAEARNVLRAGKFDVVLLDHALGDGTAFDLFEDVGEIPFVIVTGSGNEEIAVQAMNAGAADYLIKDQDSNYLITLPNTISNTLAHQRARDELIRYREYLEELVEERTDELARTNKMLQQSEEDFRLLAENSIDCIWVLDIRLRFTYLSPSLEEILGFKPEQWVGTKLSSHFKKKEFLKVGAIAAKAITNYKTFTQVTFETKILNSKNDEVNIEISSKALLNSQGKLIGLQGTTKDITERKLADEKLHQSEERYRSVVEDLPGMVNRFLFDGTITFVNQETCKFFGKKRDELIGMNIISTVPEEDREFVVSNLASITEESPIQTFENRVIRHDGEACWMRWTNRALFDNEGQKISIQSFGEDITASKQVEEKEQQHIQNIAYLSKTAMQFVDFSPQEDLHRFIGEQLQELAGESIVVVNSIDQAKGILTTRAVAGIKKYIKSISERIGRNPVGMNYDAKDEALAYLTDGELHDYKGGLYGIFLKTVPEPACRAIEKLFRLNKIYTIGFVQHERLFGSAVIFLPQGVELESVEIIKLFIEQASIAIQRRQAEEAFRQEQEKAQKYLDIAGVMIVALNKESEITLVNQKGASILGYQVEELIEKNWFDTFIPKRERENGEKRYINLMTGENKVHDHFEETIVTRSGEERIIDWHSVLLWEWGEEKRIIGILSSGEDITERVLAEEALRESEEKFRTLYDSSRDAIMMETSERFISGNPAAIEMFGCKDIEEFISQTPASLSPEYQPDGTLSTEASQKMFAVVMKEGSHNFEWVHKRLDGHEFPATVLLTSMELQGMKICQANVRDITERKAFMRELQQERDKAQKYLDIARVAFLVLNKKGEITLINPKGLDILGYERDELIGKNWFETCLPERGRKEMKRVFRKIMTGEIGSVEFYENLVLTKSGEERIIAWHNAILRDEKGHSIGTLGSGGDITERVRIEQAMIVMSDTQRQIVNQDKRIDIYQLVGKKIQELIGDGYVITTMYDEQIEAVKVIRVDGLGDRYETLVQKLKFDPFKSAYKLKDMPANHLRSFNSGKLEKYEGDLYNLLARKVPRNICNIIENEFNVTDIYVIGFTWHALDSGGVTILSKCDIAPFKDMIETIINQAAIAIKRIRSEEDLRKSEQKLRRILDGTIHTIAATVEVRDPYTAGHQTRVADLSAAIASEMRLSEEQVEGVRMAGMIHDLGKIHIPAEILSKPGKISELEYEIIKTHSQVGFDLLKDIEFPWPIARMVHQHHEKMDGSGYPQGLKGDEILLEARILAVADVVEAMSSHRPYRPALGIEKALEQIRQDKGTLLDPRVVDACCREIEQGHTQSKD